MTLDLHGSLKTTRALTFASRATNVATAGDIVDLQDFPAVLFVFQSGTLTDGSFACTVEHGDSPTLSDATTATADELIGAAPSFSATEDDAVKKVGYRRAKRYARVVVTQTGATSGGVIGALAILGAARIGPVS